jgi:hypothetical protein
MHKFNYTTESAKSTVRAVTARALAQALICGIAQAEAEGRPLTQVQCIDLATLSVMAYDEAIDACHGIDLEAKLLDVAWNS